MMPVCLALKRHFLYNHPLFLVLIITNAGKETGELVEATFSHNMAHYIGVEHIGKPHGVIWAPSPANIDWFKRLRNEGYDGKRVLLAGLNGRQYFDELAKNATSTIIMPTRNIVDKILQVLK